MSHYDRAEALLKRVEPRNKDNEVLLAEAYCHAMLAVVEELQKMNARLRRDDRQDP